jgi:hypothetical protein
MNITALKKRPTVFNRFTGLTVTEFEELSDKFRSIFYLEYIAKLKNNPDRKRAYGAGRPSDIGGPEEMLLFILFYVKVYPLQFVQGMVFDIAESSACYWIHILMPILDKSLGVMHTIPKRGKNVAEILKEYPELQEMGILLDGTERPKRKPKDKGKNKTQYSGKKKRHSVKNIVLTNPEDKTVVYLGNTYDGSIHDKTCTEMDKIEFLGRGKEKIPILIGADLGFEALKIEGAKIALPYKKPKGKDLSSSQKSQNTQFSRVRVRVENAICGVKRSRIVFDVIRNTKLGFDDLVMSVSCGLHNYRVANRYIKS